MNLTKFLIMPLFALLFIAVPSLFIGLFFILGWILAILSLGLGFFASFVGSVLVPLLPFQNIWTLGGLGFAFFFAAGAILLFLGMAILTWYAIKFVGSFVLYLAKT